MADTPTPSAATFAGWTEILPAYLYDWNQDGSPHGLQGCAFVGDDEWKPAVGQQIVLQGDGLAVVTVVIRVSRSSTRDGWFIHTVYGNQATGSVRNAG